MEKNEELWNKLSRLPKTLHPPIPEELTEDIYAARQAREMTISELAAESGISNDMMRNIIYGMLKRINYSVIRVCNILYIDVSNYIEDVKIKE